MAPLARVFLLFLSLSFALPQVSFSSERGSLETLVQKGKSLIREESYPAGIAILETVLAEDPKHAEALNLLMAAYDVYSRELVAQNRFDQAQTYLKKMEELIPRLDLLPAREFSSGDSKAESRVKREAASAKMYLLGEAGGKGVDLVSLNAGRERYNEAVQKFNERQYEAAKELLQESISLDTTNPYAYELLGEIANLNHELDRAEEYYRKAFALNPDPALRAKYEKLVSEKAIDERQEQYSDEHFIIRYRRSEHLEGSEIRDYLRNAYRAISQDFGHYPRYKIPVILYDREEYQTLIKSAPHWSGAVYDGKIRLPVYGKALDRDIQKLIYHELTHAFVLDLSRMKCPVWLNEGIAQYQENKIHPIDTGLLKNAVRRNTLLSVDELMFEEIAKSTSEEKVRLFYLESFSFVSYLLGRSRWYNVKQLLIELGRGTSFSDAFEKVFGRTFHSSSSDWREDLENHFAST